MNGIHLLILFVIGISVILVPKRIKSYKNSVFSKKYNIILNEKKYPKNFQQYNNEL